MKRVGIIGAGHMGGALLQGLLRAQFVEAQDVIISGGSSGKAKILAQETGCTFAENNVDVAKNAQIIILGVLPKFLPSVLDEIQSHITPEKILISLASSFTIAEFESNLPKKTSLARAVPNIPVSICAGMTSIAPAQNISAEALDTITQLFKAVGNTIFVPENKLNIASTIAGCSPAFFAMFIEALADGGVLLGLNREQAYVMAKQAALGTAATLLATNEHPAMLKDAVSSPGGMTIKGVAALEANGLRHAVIEAVKAAHGN